MGVATSYEHTQEVSSVFIVTKRQEMLSSNVKINLTNDKFNVQGMKFSIFTGF